jgi:predicted nucleic acid-binding protein
MLGTTVYLFDTNVLSELRKKQKANKGVKAFIASVIANGDEVYLSVVTIGEVRRGIELLRCRHDEKQAKQLEKWLITLLEDYQDNILDIDQDIAQLWGKLRAPHAENALDKQIAATAIIHGLTIVTRNAKDFASTGAIVVNPFE